MNGDALGTSDLFLSFQEELTRLADTERPVLVLGERGTGKELAARRLHYLSRRWEKPLVIVLCPGLSPTLLESELFGHEAGAFTGARVRRPGRFELADGGTLFLDEVGDMPLPLQDKLLRVIEYGTFERVGGTSTLRPDVRLVAATNQDLPRLAEEGRFRADLLDRLSFEVVHAPPLRLRGGDVILLATHFVASLSMERGLPEADMRSEKVFGTRAMQQLQEHSWPGNVRELKNAVERSLLRQGGLPILSLVLDPFRPAWKSSAPEDGSEVCTELPGVRNCPEATDFAQYSLHPPTRNDACVQSPGRPWDQPWDQPTKWPDDRPDERPEGRPEGQGERTALLPAGQKGSVVLQASPSLPEELSEGFQLHRVMERLERDALEKAMRQARYRQGDAARLLGLTYHQFRALYRRLNGGDREKKGNVD